MPCTRGRTVGLTCCIAHSLSTVDTETCDGGFSVIRGHTDVKHAPVSLISATCVRFYSTKVNLVVWVHPDGQDTDLAIDKICVPQQLASREEQACADDSLG
ncbi:hypothetical protein N7450_011482 [Penicillium hetheringtonii]|uniref:Uncharacterized protein n=1 Tax=Penicillium hetheringtonii TaxID=911720 RepID=A0AAD6DAB3_9EURO|nr:hypothetical protein N7450_011482 [Penicillium hetheringtonii]